jgi:hypothetical protein
MYFGKHNPPELAVRAASGGFFVKWTKNLVKT